ncbi:MAG: tRNA (adenosine(37)-N6)-threonylcarbamoyltransferase complex ATPase subunit type 1 TsaE [Clostridia bacterium]
MSEFISNNLNETYQIATDLAKSLKPNDIIAYSGTMGMGKTAFTRGLVEALGGGDIVSSPTFAIINQYDTPKFIVYHFDMYRVESWDDLYSTGFFDYLDTGAIIIIEWSENITGALPKGVIFVDISMGDDDNSRIIKIDRS